MISPRDPNSCLLPLSLVAFSWFVDYRPSQLTLVVMEERKPLLSDLPITTSSTRSKTSRRKQLFQIAIITFCSCIIIVNLIKNEHYKKVAASYPVGSRPHPYTASSDRSIDWSFLHPSNVCDQKGLQPIGSDEFTSRRNVLGDLLSGEGDEKEWGVYITEPGPNTLYYVNLTLNDWYLSERPWLLAISPSSEPTQQAHLTVLTPSFELSRSQNLPFALTSDEFDKVDWVTWEEEQDPYQILVDHLSRLKGKTTKGKEWRLHLEENVRTFIADGIEKAVGKDGKVGLASQLVREQRMRKTRKEFELQKCVAKVTVEALRAVRKHLRIGMTEKEGEALISNALTSAGLTDLSLIVLFGSNAALPHASASTTKKLEEGEFTLFDVGGTLRGYVSDFTRTMLPDPAPGYSFFNLFSFSLSPPERTWPSVRAKRVWTLVHSAQEAAFKILESTNVTAAEVDLAARKVITDDGFGKYFTHRVGHGIGLQVHEQPYLNAGNTELILVEGETFSNEPGIYIEREIGVRLEDMVLKTRNGGSLVSGQKFATSPWDP